MYVYEEVTIKADKAHSIACDRCGTEYTLTGEGEMEAQEFVSIMHVCGYNSIFGDGEEINIDLCQVCLKDVLGDVVVAALEGGE